MLLMVLQEMKFYETNIHKIDPNTFKGLKNLKSINISRSRKGIDYEPLDLNVFKGLNNLESINFGYNSIKELDPEIFRFDEFKAN